METIHPFEKAGLGKAPFRVAGFEKATYQACPGAPIQPGTSCDYCGTDIMNVYHIRGIDGSSFKVGSDCVVKTSWNTQLVKEVKAMVKAQRRASIAEKKKIKRKAYRIAREEAAKKAAAEQLANNPKLAAALALADKSDILADMKTRLDQFGALSERQVAFALKLATQLQAPPELKVEVVAGRRTLKGTILGFKTVSSAYGDVTKMIFKTDDGQKVFGTVPRSLFDQAHNMKSVGSQVSSCDMLRGATIEFIATIEASSTDAFFGFFSRPTKATVVSVTWQQNA